MKSGHKLVRRLGLGLLAALSLAGLAYVFMRSGPMAPTRVTLHTVATASVAPALFGIGTVEARRSYVIGPTAAARVLRVAVDVGDAVEAGQLLAEMDFVDIDERLAALDASIARAGSLAAAMQAQRREASARSDMAAMNARRYVELGQQNFISATVVEAKLLEQSSADAGVSAAEANLAAARQDIQRLTAERAAVRRQRDNARLLAPTDALVVSRDAEAGSTLVAGQPVIKLVEAESLWVSVRFDQGRSAGLAEGLRASIVLRSRPAQALAGRVARVEALSDSVTEERVVQVAFDRLPRGLSIGELAEVTVALPVPAPTLVVPNASLLRQGEHTGVWRIDGDTLRFAPLRLGQTGLDGQVQVLDGLQAGDRVVVYSEQALHVGSRIKVVDTIAARQP
jgi:HlyD family secretion protein